MGVDVGAVEIYQNLFLDRQRGVKRVQRERETNALARSIVFMGVVSVL